MSIVALNERALRTALGVGGGQAAWEGEFESQHRVVTKFLGWGLVGGGRVTWVQIPVIQY